jgi:transcriptional regulator of acetoin/glycerol metabolism
VNSIPEAGAQGALLAASAPSALLRSWQRCTHLAADLQDEPIALSAGDLADRFEQHACVLRAAQPEIDTLAGMVASASSLVLLADASGVILRATGNNDFIRRADQVALRPGVSWAEHHRGTNAIGTALIEATALRVHGEEHFLPRNRILSCHASPIRSPRGDILGVLDISGDARGLHAYALGLADMCARQVANRVIEHAGGPCRHLVFHRHAAMLDSVDRGLLLIEDERIVGMNEAAIGLLGASWATLLDQPLARWLEDWKALGAQPRDIRSTEGSGFHALLRPAEPGTALKTRHTRHAPAAPITARAPARTTPLLAPDVQAGFEHARKALDAGLGVLVQGDTGTGKEIYAQKLHAESRWRRGPFVAVNCGALPETLIEAELFGYEPGAYTGARRNGARGRLREADGGVLFLDEIGDMPLALQTRLLRVIQERSVQPLGADKPVAVEFGLISATNRDLPTLIQAGAFRPDLFYRLQDYGVCLPPLNQRADLRTALCAALHEEARQQPGALGLTLADDALDALTAYAWPGNYRQLRSVLRTLALFHPPGSLVHAEHLPAEITGEASNAAQTQKTPPSPTQEEPAALNALPADPTLRSTQAECIARTLQQHGGNIGRTAHALGIHRSTLYRHLARRVN